MGEAVVTTPVEGAAPGAKPRVNGLEAPEFADAEIQSGLAQDTPGEDEAPNIPTKKGAGEGGEQQKQPPKKAKVKLADREIELDEEVAALLKEPLEVYERRRDHTRAANDRFQKAADIAATNDAKYGKDAIQRNPFAIFQLAAEAGIDPTALVAEYARQALAQEKWTPEQRAFEADKAKYQSEAAKLEQEKAKIDQERHGKEVQAFRERFAKNVAPVLTKYDLPDDDITVGEIGRRVAAQVRAEMPEDYEAAAEDYSDYISQNVKRHLDRLSRTPGALAKAYPEIAKRLREEDVASAISPRVAVRAPGKQVPAPELQQRNTTQSWRDEEAEFRARRFGLKK